MTKSKHWMLDIEAMGEGIYPVVTEIAIVEFDPFTETIAEPVSWMINIADSAENGCELSSSTWNWWMSQDPYLRMAQLSGTQKIKDVLKDMRKYIKFEDYVWSHATYDTSTLTRLFDKFNIQIPWARKHEVDLRTIRFLAENYDLKPQVAKADNKHSAASDVIAQAKTLQSFFHNLEKVMV